MSSAKGKFDVRRLGSQRGCAWVLVGALGLALGCSSDGERDAAGNPASGGAATNPLATGGMPGGSPTASGATGGDVGSGGAVGEGGRVGTGGSGGVVVESPTSVLILDRATVVLGQTLHGTATYTNGTGGEVTLLNVVIALRPPGGTHAGGPYEDLVPAAQDITLAPGESFTLEASRAFAADDPTGTWEAYLTFEDQDGYHDQASTFVEVVPAGTPGTGGASGTGGTPGGCNATTTPVARHGKLRIEGNQLVNECGRPVQFTSMSMYDWSEQGRQFYNADAVKNLAGTGEGQKRCTLLRIPLLARNWPGDYDRVKRVMDACLAHGIYCMPNWHVIGGSDVNAAKAFYVQLAQDYGDTPNIIYEPWNEPTDQSWSEIKGYMEEILAAVRPIDPDGILLAGTRQWCQRPDEACQDPIDDPHVGYVFHFYANSHALDPWFRDHIEVCRGANKLVWSTEYGGVDADGDGSFNVAEVNRWWDYMDDNLISSNNWAVETNGETSSVFTENASDTGPWPDAQITNSGRLVFAHIAERYPVTMSQ